MEEIGLADPRVCIVVEHERALALLALLAARGW